MRLYTRSAISWRAARQSYRSAIAPLNPSSKIRGFPSCVSSPATSGHQTRRTLTNASRPDYVPSLLDVQKVQEKPGGWHPTLIHSSGDLKWTVIRLQPGGGEVPRHMHNAVWDYFVPLSGQAVIEVKTKDGEEKNFEMREGTFLAVPPEDVHCVRNKSEDEEFVFLIAQTPRSKYDFVAK